MLRSSRTTTVKGSTKSDISGKAVAANVVEMLSRRRNSWHFLAWAFLTVDALGSEALAYTKIAHGADDDDGDASGLYQIAADGSGSDDGEFLDLVADSSAFDDGSGLGGSSLGASPPPFNFGNYLGHRIDAGGVGHGRFATSDDNVGGSSGRGGFGTGGPGTGAGGDGSGPGTTPVDAFFTPTIDFFNGFNPFSEALGFGEFKTIADLLPDASKGIVAAGVQFADSPLAPIFMWQSLGEFAADARFYKTDSFNAEYTVQANGFNDKTFNSMQDATNVNDGVLIQYGDEATKSLGNAATLVDGQDWTGALVVKGNYFEFNTIVQINIIWNNDEVLIERTGANGETAPLVVNTGDNTQANYAQIIEYANTGAVADQSVAVNELTYEAPADSNATATENGSTLSPAESSALFTAATNEAGATGSPSQFAPALPPPPQVINGGVDQHYGVVQRTAIVQQDKLEFTVADAISGNNTTASVAPFADLNTGGNEQANKSVIAPSSGLSYAQGVSISDYIDYVTESTTKKVEVIAGDYYEFNTIFQVNLIKDNNVITKTLGYGSGGNSGWGPQIDVLASGGNIQLNTASLEKNDSHDYLYVGGKYSQYNLVLQVSALENSSLIKQISKVQYGGLPIDLAGIDYSSAKGNGNDGGNQSFTLPSALDELQVRGQTVDVSL